ncbi:MAG: DNA polymerase IV [Promethearchaeota archaeon]
MGRMIFHCDLDCFFASVEIRDNPEYKNKPVIIGADPKGGKGRGVVSTCSYEAREFGLHSGMPISQAYKQCPHGIYLRPSFKKYKQASKEVMTILKSFTPHFQQAGLDEAYLDVSETCDSPSRAIILAEQIQKEVFNKVGITVSIGCAETKSLAKIASDLNKPNGITMLMLDEVQTILKDLDITKIPGIGKKSKKYYHEKGIKTIGDLIKLTKEQAIHLLGKRGLWAWNVVHGIDNREIETFPHFRKSMSKERTFYEDTNDFGKILSTLERIAEKLDKYARKHDLFFRTITLKIRFSDFRTFVRSKTFRYPIQGSSLIMKTILELYEEFSNQKKKVRLIGIKLSNFLSRASKKQTTLMQFMIS